VSNLPEDLVIGQGKRVKLGSHLLVFSSPTPVGLVKDLPTGVRVYKIMTKCAGGVGMMVLLAKGVGWLGSPWLGYPFLGTIRRSYAYCEVVKLSRSIAKST